MRIVLILLLVIVLDGCAEQPNAFSLDEGTIYHVGPFNFDSARPARMAVNAAAWNPEK